MDYSTDDHETPGWAQQLLVVPTLVAIDLRLWVAPERERWSICASSYDHLNEAQLSMHVGNERHGLKKREIVHVMTTHLAAEWRRYVDPHGPFDQRSPG